jgi:hypothetical protein
MSLLHVVRAGIAVADSVTQPLQATVMFAKYTGSDEYGEAQFADPMPIAAIVDWKQKQLRTQGGILSVSRASVLFIDIKELMKVTNNEGVSDEDKIVLPDGTTGPILDMAGFIDAGTGLPMTTEVFLG